MTGGSREAAQEPLMDAQPLPPARQPDPPLTPLVLMQSTIQAFLALAKHPKHI